MQKREENVFFQVEERTEIEQILLAPDTHVGSMQMIEDILWISHETRPEIVRTSSVQWIPGLYKLFDEVAVNALDHVRRMMDRIQNNGNTTSDETAKAVTYIRVSVDASTGWISVENDGNSIDVVQVSMAGSEGAGGGGGGIEIWQPEMAFTRLRTSTNYKQDEERLVGGKNGYGAKLAGIWSTQFSIDLVDHIRQLRYTQTIRDNLRCIEPPVITSATKKQPNKKPYTRISFLPDYARMGIPGGLSEYMVRLMKKRVYDMVGLLGHFPSPFSRVKVYWNNEELTSYKTFSKYVQQLYFPTTTTTTSSSSCEEEKDGEKEKEEEKKDDEEGAEGNKEKEKEKREEQQQQVLLYEAPNERWEYVVTTSPFGEFAQMSFVNGICTTRGGKHVDYIMSQITQKVIAYITKKKKNQMVGSLFPANIQSHLMLFLRCDIVNPTFDSQSKDYLSTAVSQFGSSCVVSDKLAQDIAVKLDVMERACAIAELKEQRRVARKTNGAKTVRVHVDKLEDANWAGTADKSKHCILYLTEGDSAKTSVVSGLSSEARNWAGVYPLKGKINNISDMSITKAESIDTITTLMTILGLKMGAVYDSWETVHAELRYGRVGFITDQDTDGSHIKGLLVNVFRVLWPSLYRLDGFLGYLNTPLIKGTRGHQMVEFYSMQDWEAWKKQVEEVGKWTFKYYKGLGTSTKAEFQKYMSDNRLIGFSHTGSSSDDALDLVFNKTRSKDRQQWLSRFSASFVESAITTTTITTTNTTTNLNTSSTTSTSSSLLLATTQECTKPVAYETFVNEELVQYSVANCVRSIPHVMDGLKPSQRKILYASFRKPLKTEIKVSQLAGYVSEHTGYHHGEASLVETIIKMGQNFVGSNNINLLRPSGQFGSRLMGGEDASSPRYIFTCLEAIAYVLFPEVDFPLLDVTYDDQGVPTEPVYYVPILPMVLINGATGVGTGHSTSILSYSPLQLTEWIRCKLRNASAEEYPELIPYYEGFTGSIVSTYGTTGTTEFRSYEMRGTWRVDVESPYVLHITELPVGVWTNTYKEWLESMVFSSKKKEKEQKKTQQQQQSSDKTTTKRGTSTNGIQGGGGGEKEEEDLRSGLVDVTHHNTDQTVNFHVYKDARDKSVVPWTLVEPNQIVRLFDLSSGLRTSNMKLYNVDGHMHHFTRVEEILEVFFAERLRLYARRREYLLKKWEQEWRRDMIKCQFIQDVRLGRVDIRGKELRVVKEELTQRYYSAIRGLGEEREGEGEKREREREKEEEEQLDGLLQMPMKSMTKEQEELLDRKQREKKTEMEELRSKTAEQMWVEELDVFEETYNVYRAQRIESQQDYNANKNKNSTGKQQQQQQKKKKRTTEGDVVVAKKPRIVK